MTLVFLRQGRLPAHDLASDSTSLVAEKYGVTARAIADALPQLKGSFVSVRQDDSQQIWGFVHPTFTDAISSMLSARSDLVELYVQGAKLETLLAEAVCEGAESIRDAVVIPLSAFEHLVGRLIGVPDVPEINGPLLEFLTNRASDTVVTAILGADSILFRREAQHQHFWRIASDRRLRFLARVHNLHRLPEEIRFEMADKLERAALNDLDASFLSDDDILALLRPTQLIRLGVQLVATLDSVVSDRISELADEADPEFDIPNQFDQVRNFVEQLQEAFSDDATVQNMLDLLSGQIDDAIADVSNKKAPEEDVGFWSNISPAKVAAAPKGRSIFSDVDD